MAERDARELELMESLKGIELSWEEMDFIKWITSWDWWTVNQIVSIINKARTQGTAPTAHAQPITDAANITSGKIDVNELVKGFVSGAADNKKQWSEVTIINILNKGESE